MQSMPKQIKEIYEFIFNQVKETFIEDEWIYLDFKTKAPPTDGDEFSMIEVSYNVKTRAMFRISVEIPKELNKPQIDQSELFSEIFAKDRINVNIERGIAAFFIGYDPKTDSAHFSFNKSTKPGIGIDLSKGVVIRIDPKTNEWLGVSLFGISKIPKY